MLLGSEGGHAAHPIVAAAVQLAFCQVRRVAERDAARPTWNSLHQLGFHELFPENTRVFSFFFFIFLHFSFLSPLHAHFGSCSGYVSISRALAPLFIYLFIYFVLVSFVVSLFYKVFWFNEKNTKGGGGETGGVEGKPSKGVGAGGATGGIEGRPRWTKAGRRWQTG